MWTTAVSPSVRPSVLAVGFWAETGVKMVGNPRAAHIASPSTGISTAPGGVSRDELRTHQSPGSPWRGPRQGFRRWDSIVPTTLRTVGSSPQRRSIFRTALMTVE
jgi:hypothetical protein